MKSIAMKEFPIGNSLLKLHTLGAAHAVTGSLFLLEHTVNGKTTRVLLDTGLTVEDPKADYIHRLPPGLKASDIHFIIIGHAHADHCGYYPKLIIDGFKGKAFATPATIDLMGIIMPDSGHLQESAAKRLSKRFERLGASINGRRRRGLQMQQATPIYTQADGEAAVKKMIAVDYHVRRRLSPEIAFTLTDAGHILGSAVVNLEIGVGKDKRTFCYTGNVGRRDMPLLRDLEPVKAADYLMLESTYGNRLHEKGDRLAVLEKKINDWYKRAKRRDPKTGCGVMLVPSFAVGRGQTFLNDVRVLQEAGRVPKFPVYVDGRMTNAATEIYKKYPAIMNNETRKILESGKDPYATSKHTLCVEWEDSSVLRLPHNEPIMIVGSSGMAAGGRIVDHLKHWLPGKQNTVLFVGYQGAGTLGSSIVRTTNGAVQDGKPVRRAPQAVFISGKPVTVAATIEFMSHYSAHADYEDQLAWLKHFKTPPKAVFIVHGDEDGLSGMKRHIEKNLGWKNIIVPNHRQVFELK